ncbi:hypothetical protein [Undibacterium umbellatum]|nr:hypothetical protein [Undibacterium umbellatum]
MDVTGADYTYFANIDPVEIELAFVKKIKEFWPRPVMEVFERDEDGVEIFFAKDAEMDFGFATSGYSLNEDGEGCFMFYCRKFSLLQCEALLKNVTAPDEIKDIDDYSSTLVLNNIWEYTLVLPGLKEESDFVLRVHQSFMDLLAVS